MLPADCIPSAIYTASARHQAMQLLANGAAAQDAAPHCADSNRIADPSTIGRWFYRRLASLRFLPSFLLSCPPTILAWDCFAFRRILSPEAIPS